MGLLDEHFVLHMEEIDLCWRLQRAGYRIELVPESVVYHLGGSSLPRHDSRKTYYNFRNSLLLLYKNLPPAAWRRTFPVRVALDVLAFLRFVLLGKWEMPPPSCGRTGMPIACAPSTAINALTMEKPSCSLPIGAALRWTTFCFVGGVFGSCPRDVFSMYGGRRKPTARRPLFVLHGKSHGHQYQHHPHDREGGRHLPEQQVGHQ